jgi:putative ABC transport system permease protein
MGIQVREGRALSSSHGTDKQSGFMVNEAFVEEYMLQDPLQTELHISGNDSTARGHIVGVVGNFHFQPLHLPIKPLVIRMDDFNAWLISVKLDGQNLNEGLVNTEKLWKEFSGGAPFSYEFMDESIASSYEDEERAFSMLISLTFFAISIAMLGLLGLTAFMTLKRRKEIGIRKVLGSSIAQLIQLFTREVIRLVVVAFVISIPLAWFVGDRWLQNFAYKIEVSPLIFVASGLVVLLFTIAIVSYQSVRAAAENPADVLRSE